MVTVRIDGREKQYGEGTTYETIVKEYQPQYDNTIALVSSNGKIRELFKKVKKDCDVSFFTLRDSVGHKTYVRSAIMLLIKALRDVAGADHLQKVKVEFAIGPGYYCSVKGDVELDDALLRRLNQRMRELVDADLPVVKKSYPMQEAMEIFRRQKMKDKEKLFRYQIGRAHV